MLDELDVHKKRQWERIEVLGILDTRTIVEDTITEKSIYYQNKQNRYLKKSETAKKFYINSKDSPVRNIYEKITTREEAIIMFDKLVWESWHECNAMEEPARGWFEERTKEYKEGYNIDLICDCRRFRGNDMNICSPTSKYPLDCHGYTLKKYIEFLVDN